MTINFTQLDATIRVPTVAVETDLVSGRTSTPSLDKKLLLMASKLSAGTGTAGQVYTITSESQARSLFGAGSELAVMVEAAMRVSQQLALYAMALTEPAGVQATGTITIAGPATGSGVLSVWIAGRLFRVGIASTDTATAIGDALAAAVNAHPNLPVTAGNVTGTVTLTARNKGIVGNTIRMRAVVTAAGVTATAGAATLASGTLAPDPTSALAGIQGDRFHLVAYGSDDSTSAGALKTDREARSNPLEQKWGEGIIGSTGNASAANALATALDSYRMQIAWLPSADVPVYELVAAFAAERARTRQRNRTLDYHALTGIGAPYDESAWLTRSEEEVALNSGVTPVRALRNGTVQIVRAIHSRKTNPAYLDHNPTEISDYIDEDLITQFHNRYADAALKVASPPNTPNVLSPARAKAVLHERMRIWDLELDYTQGAETDIKAGRTQAEPNAEDTSRLDVAYPFRPVFGAHVIAILKTLTLPTA